MANFGKKFSSINSNKKNRLKQILNKTKLFPTKNVLRMPTTTTTMRRRRLQSLATKTCCREIERPNSTTNHQAREKEKPDSMW
jgi:hypothetical protein